MGLQLCATLQPLGDLMINQNRKPLTLRTVLPYSHPILGFNILSTLNSLSIFSQQYNYQVEKNQERERGSKALMGQAQWWKLNVIHV